MSKISVTVKDVYDTLGQMIEDCEVEPENEIHGAVILKKDTGKYPANALLLFIGRPDARLNIVKCICGEDVEE